MASCSYTPRKSPKREKDSEDKDDLIEIVNKLQNKLADIGQTLDISLPQIVVVGCQSAGKSSVLESIVGKEFLPRGTGTVTRRPTVVQLEKSEKEYAKFLHKKDEIFTNFEDVRNEIKTETLKNPGPDCFSPEPIYLKIFSPNVLKLTLVDLPGLIRVPVGAQPESSIAEVREMVMQFIRQPNSLILAVSPANQDIADSAALEIAKIVDPERVRTIGVVTKIDLMDKGTDARSVLENEGCPLKRGYVGVLNRSQQDIDEEKDFDYCLEKEKNFFESTPCYKDLAHRMGTQYLKKFLNKQLYAHIKESLPAVRQELSQKLEINMKSLKDFNSQTGNKHYGNRTVHSYMIKLLQKFIEGLLAEIFGYSEKVPMDGLSAGSIINCKLNCRRVKEDLKIPKVPDEAQLMAIIVNVHGIRNTISFPSLALEAVAHHVLPQYLGPVHKIVDSITEILQSTTEKCSEMMNSYPKLKNELLFLLRKSIQEAALNTKESLEEDMQAEMYFVNVYHADFVFPEVENIENIFPLTLWDESDIESKTGISCGSISRNTVEDSKAIELLSANIRVEENVQALAKIVKEYLAIHHIHLEHTVKTKILFRLIKTTKDYIKEGLIPTIMDSADIDSILEECGKDFEKINKVKATCECLEDALNAVQTF